MKGTSISKENQEKGRGKRQEERAKDMDKLP